MDRRRSGFYSTALLGLLAVACDARPLDPRAAPAAGEPAGRGGGVTPLPADLPTALRVLAGPNTLIIVGTNAGAVTQSRSGSASVFEQDPETLVEAAAVVGMPVCSVEMQSLVTLSTTPDPQALTIAAALDACDHTDYGDMLARLAGLKLPETVVVIAANTAITARTTSRGINFFYEADILRLLRAARKMYVPACVIAPDSLSLPTYPQGQTPGLSIDDALARCGF